MHLILSYFHSKRGPELFLSFPDEVPEKISDKMKGFFDLDMIDPFFEVTLIEEKIKITNLYFEITSCWARGSKEMVMLSLVIEKDYKSELFYDILKEYSLKIISIVNIYKSFYDRGFLQKNDPEIDIKKKELVQILVECLDRLNKLNKSDFEGEKIIQKFKKFKW